MLSPDVVVIGGGIIGVACAHRFASHGLTTTVLESGPEPGAATPAAAGMLTTFAESDPADPMFVFSVRARDLYAELIPALQEETGLDIAYRTDGILQLALDEDDITRLREAVSMQRQSGFTVDWLSIDEVRKIAPGVGPDVLGAAMAAEDGGLDPLALHQALLESARRRHGVEIVASRGDQLLFDGERVTGVRTASGTVSAGAVVLAAGCWSSQVRGLPRALPVEPIRGQMVALDWPPDEPPATVYAGHGYVMERRGEAIGGSTMEHVGYDPSTTQDGLDDVLAKIRRIYPALGNATVRRTWAGLRPGTPDMLPIIGRDPTVTNLWYATGHGRNGILLAGITGEVLLQLFTGEEVEYDLTPVDPARLWPA